MEIHKPKAAHSWGEFLTEIGTIICGILIALGLEQGIELLHWRHEVSEEREAVHAEIRRLKSSMLGRMSYEPCFTARLAEVQTVIARHDAHQPLGIRSTVGRPLYPPLGHTLWDLAVADQSLAHMDLEEKRKLADAYAWATVYGNIAGDERTAWKALQALNHADKLTEADWSQVRKDFEQATDAHTVIISSFQRWIRPLDAVAPGAVDPAPVRFEPPVRAFCTPLLAPGRPAGG